MTRLRKQLVPGARLEWSITSTMSLKENESVENQSDGSSTHETIESESNEQSSFQRAVTRLKKVGVLQICPGEFNNTKFRTKVMNHVTLEPMLFLKMMAEGTFRVVGDTLEIDRVCRVNLNFSHEDCMAMDDGNHSDVQVSNYTISNSDCS